MKNSKLYITAMVSKVLVVFLSLLSSALINRNLGVELKGDYAYICNLESIFIVIFSFGLGQTYSFYHKKYKNKFLNTFITLSFIHALICFGIMIVSILFCNNNITLALLVSILATIRTNILYYAAIEDIKKRDILNIFYKFIYTILVIIFFIFFKKNIIAMLILLIIDDLIILIGSFVKYNFRISLKSLLLPTKTEYKKIYLLAFTTMLMLLMMSLNYNVDILLLKKFSTSYSIGIYSVSIQLANMVWLIPDAFKDVLFHKNSKEDSISDIIFSTKFNIYLNLIIILLFIIFGKSFINIIYGSEYLPSYYISILLFIGCISMVIYKMIHPIYISNGKQIIVLTILSISVILNIILNNIFIPRYDIIGAAISSIFSYFVCSIIFLIFFCKDYKIKLSNFFIIKKEDISKLKKEIKL